MKYVYLALNWIFGVLLLVGGIALTFKSFLGGLTLILMSLLLLPPAKEFAHSKINKTLTSKERSVALFVLFIGFMVFTIQSQEANIKEAKAAKAQAQIEEMAALKKKNIEFFGKNSVKILRDMQAAFDDKKYKKVLSSSSRYVATKNKELIELRKKANAELTLINNAKRTKMLLDTLKATPKSNHKLKMDLYQKISNYNPKNETYKKKHAYYLKKVLAAEKRAKAKKAKEEKQRLARIAKFGEAPVRSAWDGSYRAVEKHLKRVANDPDSIEIDNCTGVYHIKSGWLVGCDYRGRNGFNAMIRQSNWFTITHGQVIKVDKASAYRR